MRRRAMFMTGCSTNLEEKLEGTQVWIYTAEINDVDNDKILILNLSQMNKVRLEDFLFKE